MDATTQNWTDRLVAFWYKLMPGEPGSVWSKVIGVALVVVLVALLALSFWWSREPTPFWVEWETAGQPAVRGNATASALIGVISTLLDKPGGYLTNDVMPPGVLLDNIPNWEWGVLKQSRDLVKSLRNDYSRSQTQSIEDADLALAEPRLNHNRHSWILPPAESQYRQAVAHLESYLARLGDPNDRDAQFYARADNLRSWLEQVEKRLGNMAQQLSASVGQRRVNTDLAGDPSAETATPRPTDVDVQTGWFEIDDVFFEARGTAWALVHFLRAAEYDFAQVLKDKNATVSLRQVIRELEASLAPIRSPIILNGSGYGMTANHSLVMASYLSSANAAVIELRDLLSKG